MQRSARNRRPMHYVLTRSFEPRSAGWVPRPSGRDRPCGGACRRRSTRWPPTVWPRVRKELACGRAEEGYSSTHGVRKKLAGGFRAHPCLALLRRARTWSTCTRTRTCMRAHTGATTSTHALDTSRPGADAAEAGRSRRRCGRGGPSPGADVTAVSAVLAQNVGQVQRGGHRRQLA